MIAVLEAADYKDVFQYQTPSGSWLPSTLYTWSDMVKGVKIMATQGIGHQKLYVGEGRNFNYGLVNLAAFLGESMKETIMYDACDENNWSNPDVVKMFGGTPYTAAYACGQGKQSYQDYKCSKEDDKIAGGKMACDLDNNMEMRAHTHAEWYGAPPAFFCAPKSKVPKAPKWNWGGPWCPPPGSSGHKTPFPDNMTNLTGYLNYVNHSGSCRDYPGIKAGGWGYCKGKACPSCPAPVFNRTGRTDVEGCCWWGRGVLQTSGVCNYGKLNFYMGKRAADEGRNSIYPTIDFCKTPNLICDPDGPQDIRWSVGFFYWLYQVQNYDVRGWNYMDKLKEWVVAGMNTTDMSFLDAASGIVNRGCHDPPCGTGEMHGKEFRRLSFIKVLEAMNIDWNVEPPAEDRAFLCLPGLFLWSLLAFPLTANAFR